MTRLLTFKLIVKFECYPHQPSIYNDNNKKKDSFELNSGCVAIFKEEIYDCLSRYFKTHLVCGRNIIRYFTAGPQKL